MRSRKFLSTILVIALVFTLAIPTTAFGATTLSDIKGHWAETYINKAVKQGIVTGYPDGKFRPDAAVSRAEFVTMVNKALGNNGSATVTFKDVPSFEWYYQGVAKAVAAAYTGGYDDGTFRPDAKISRQEAAVMISRIVPTYGYTASLSKFKDGAKVASWAATAVSKVNGKGYIGAYDDGLLHPEDSLTRAQTAKIITEMIDKENIVKSVETVKKDDTTLSNRIYANGVTIHKDLDDGDATINNCVVLGTLLVQGGGLDSVTVQNSRIANATVSRADDPVRLLLKGETTVNALRAERIATIETSSLAGGDFGAGAKTLSLIGSSNITLAGSFPKVSVDGRTAELTLNSGTITDLDITASGRDAIIAVESKATVTNATVNAQAAFQGEGTIRTMDVQANSVTYEKKPSTLRVASGVTTKPVQVTATAGKFDPKDGETGVKASVDPTITFSYRIETAKGDKIDSDYLEDKIVFKRNDSKGANVPFTAKINSANKIITIMPDENLVDGKYYLGFAKSAFRNYDTEEALIASYVTWTVGNVSDDVTFKPANGDKNVSKTVKPTLTFEEAIETYGGKDITGTRLSEIIDDDDLYLYKGTSKSNRLGSGDASINSAKKVITISPGELSEGEYTLGFKSNTFRTKADGKKIAAASVKFTVGNPAPTVTFNPSNGAKNVGLTQSIVITFSERMYNSSGKSDSSAFNATYLDGAVTVKDGSTTLKTSKSFPSGYTKLTISPPTGGWTAGKTYTITVNASKFRNSSGAYAAKTESAFNTSAALSALTVNYGGSPINALATKSATVPYGTNEVTITATASGSIAVKITGPGNLSSDGTGKAEGKFALASGYGSSTTFTITVGGASWGTLTVTKAGPDTTGLSNAITAANDAKEGVIVATTSDAVTLGEPWVTSSEMTDLTKAITDATSVKNLSTATMEQVSAATGALTAATKLFKDSIQYGTLDKGELVTLINDCKSFKIGIKESKTEGSEWDADQQWVTPEVMSTFESAISAGEAALSSATTKAEIESAVINLTAAKATFNDAISQGTKAAPPVNPGP